MQSLRARVPMASKTHVENIIISGAGGTLGKHVVAQLLAQGKHRVSALTRPSSTSTLPTGLHAVKRVDQADHDALVAALRGEDALIITLAPGVAVDAQKPLIAAAAAAGVRYIMPNEYGIDYSDAALTRDSGVGARALEIRRYIEEAAAAHGSRTHWLALSCSFWYEFSLAGMEIRYGFDFARKRLTLIDDGNARICTTTWEQCARAIARLFALPLAASGSSSGDASPTLSQWEDGAVLVNSFTLSQRDMFASVLRVTGDREEDWTISHEKSTERYQRGVEMLQGGDVMGGALMVYTRVFYPNGGGDFSHKVVNRQLGLPDEDLDAATRAGVEVHNSGFWGERLAAIAARAKK